MNDASLPRKRGRNSALRTAVNPSMDRTHAFDGWPRTATLGLRGPGSAQRNAADKTCDAMLPCIAASRCSPSLANQIGACASPLFCTLRATQSDQPPITV